MKKINNILNMPFILKVIVLCGILAPVIVFISVVNCQLPPALECVNFYGNANNIFELLAVIAAALPVSLASYLIIIKNRKALILWGFSWILICISPIFLSSLRSNLSNGYESFWLTLAPNVLVGIIVLAYLLVNKEVRHYFES